jgi:hypothetical protein
VDHHEAREPTDAAAVVQAPEMLRLVRKGLKRHDESRLPIIRRGAYLSSLVSRCM